MVYFITVSPGQILSPCVYLTIYSLFVNKGQQNVRNCCRTNLTNVFCIHDLTTSNLLPEGVSKINNTNCTVNGILGYSVDCHFYELINAVVMTYGAIRSREDHFSNHNDLPEMFQKRMKQFVFAASQIRWH